MTDRELAAIDTTARVLDVVNDGSIDPEKLLERKRKIKYLLENVMEDDVFRLVLTNAINKPQCHRSKLHASQCTWNPKIPD